MMAKGREREFDWGLIGMVVGGWFGFSFDGIYKCLVSNVGG